MSSNADQQEVHMPATAADHLAQGERLLEVAAGCAATRGLAEAHVAMAHGHFDAARTIAELVKAGLVSASRAMTW